MNMAVGQTGPMTKILMPMIRILTSMAGILSSAAHRNIARVQASGTVLGRSIRTRVTWLDSPGLF